MTKVLVTGGFGFIGMAIVRRLADMGRDVRILDLRMPPPGWIPHLRKPVLERNSPYLKTVCPDFPDRSIDVIVGDMRNPEICRLACDNVEIVMHFAGLSSSVFGFYRPKDAVDINVRGTRTLLNAAEHAGVRRIVYASSAKVYGFNRQVPVHEDDVPRPRSSYALSKLISEEHCRQMYKRSGIESVILRLFTVYGPGLSLCSGIIGPLICSCVNSRPAIIKENNSACRDFTYVEDAVTAAIKAMTVSGIGTEVFNVGTGMATSVTEVLAILRDISGHTVEINFDSSFPGVAYSSHADMTHSRAVLQFFSETSLKEGLRNTFAWYTQLHDTLTFPVNSRFFQSALSQRK
jgi:UDP-glucose 4-epimerase